MHSPVHLLTVFSEYPETPSACRRDKGQVGGLKNLEPTLVEEKNMKKTVWERKWEQCDLKTSPHTRGKTTRRQKREMKFQWSGDIRCGFSEPTGTGPPTVIPTPHPARECRPSSAIRLPAFQKISTLLWTSSSTAPWLSRVWLCAFSEGTHSYCEGPQRHPVEGLQSHQCSIQSPWKEKEEAPSWQMVGK